jgi:hypothetical protein
MTGSSQYDSYAAGCREGDCRYHWVTTTRAETCTYQPDLPEAGWYRVYVTCNQSSPNVHDVGVTINHAWGAERFLWDQADAAHLNRWVPVADQSFFFEAGTAGTVVWDDFEAWPTSGDHVFRGDATKFSLDNRVEIDGVGGVPGRFASLSEALAWLATHSSEEPDVINITCDTLVETGCIEVNLLDDVTINGDGDGNGVPVTIVVTPGAPADWSEACGMYLDVPIQHQYTLRDLVLVPQYVSEGWATDAYGLVLDERNPSGEACALSLTLENVTVAGSLPGNLPTDAQVDTRALATMFGGPDADTGAAVLQRTSDWAGDAGCRQSVSATNLTITHSTTRGLVVRSAYTDWDIDGGLRVTYCGLEGVLADHLDGSALEIHDSSGSNPNQIAGNLDGGLINRGSAGVEYVGLQNCVINDNLGSLGGGILSYDATTIVTSCLLYGNHTTGWGGAAFGVDGTLTLTNCTMVDNSAVLGGGALYSWGSNLIVANSILWQNGAEPIDGGVTASYCDVQGGYSGLGNIDLDPRFVDPAARNYHLSRNSPCVNEGDCTLVTSAAQTDIDGEQRVQGGFVDIGADETPYWDGDIDQDGDVDHDDFAAAVECLAGPGTPVSPPPPWTVEECLAAFDFDEDGDIDLRDYADFRPRAPVVVSDVILETRDESGSLLPPPAYVEDGNWHHSAAKSTAGGLTGLGSRYITYELPNSGTDNATFVPAIPVPGLYEVFVTWGTGANCFDALYTIEHQDGRTTLLVDQIPEGVPDANANTWVSLGQYRFDAGQSAASGSVNVSEETVSGQPHPSWNLRVYADAAKWVFITR